MKKWNIDPNHSEIGFRVKHMMFTNVKGHFDAYDANIVFEDNLNEASFDFNARVNSITTNNHDRDNHLKSADFFDVEQFPSLSFKSTSIKENGKKLEISGDLTIKGITKPII
ncbi:MAG TPA: YceI family protein, partial [Flavobacterium sp.]|nr:YceI family protein [Flavobacterium sp.]